MDREKRPYKTHQVCFRREVAFLLNVTNIRNKKTNSGLLLGKF